MRAGEPDPGQLSRGRRRATWAGLGALIACALLVGPLSSPASAAFSGPVPLSTSTDVDGAEATIDPVGDVFAVWSQRGAAGWSVQVRLISSNGTLGPVETLSAAAPVPLKPQIAMDNDDYGAIVVWSQPDGKSSRVKARRIGPHGRLGATENLSGRRRIISGPRIASGGDNYGATVVWSQAQQGIWRIKARRLLSTAKEGLDKGSVKTLSGARHKAKDPEIASNERGDAVIVWSQRGPASSRITDLAGPVKARRISENGHVRPAKTLSDPGRGAGEAQAAVDNSGHAIVVWSEANAKGTRPRVKARRMGTFAGAPRGVMSLSPKNSLYPEVGTGVRGNATVVWDTIRRGKGSVEARQISPRSKVGPAQALSVPGASADSPQVGTDFGGNATVVWSVFQKSGDWPVQARQISGGGKLGPLQTLSSASGIRQPQITVNGGGQNGAFAIWSQLDGSAWRVWSARGAT
jgi:uncharacterized protein YheU (UPF0270 family)